MVDRPADRKKGMREIKVSARNVWRYGWNVQLELKTIENRNLRVEVCYVKGTC